MKWLFDLGYLGLFIGAFLSGTIIPSSSDFLLVGMLSLGGNWVLCLIIATIGNWLGGVFSYGLGFIGKWEWLERWFRVKKEKLEKQKNIINKYGIWVVLISWVPVIGSLGIISLGFYKIKPKTTLALLLIVCFVRFLMWTVLYALFAERVIEFLAN